MAEGPVIVPGLPPGFGSLGIAWAKGFFGSGSGTLAKEVRALTPEQREIFQDELPSNVRGLSNREQFGEIQRALRIAQREPIIPDTPDPFDPEYADFPSPIVADQMDSPVFGGAVVAGIFGTDKLRELAVKKVLDLEKAAKRKAAGKREAEMFKKAAQLEKAKGRLPYAAIAKSLGRSAKATFPGAVKVLTQAAKLGAKAPKIGAGPAGLAGFAAQLGIEKLSSVMEKRQFGEMEKILKADNARMKQIGAAARRRAAATPAQKAPGLQPKAAKRPPSSSGRTTVSEPSRPVPAPSVATVPKPPISAVQTAEKPWVKSSAGSYPLPPPRTIGLPAPVKAALEFGQKYGPLFSLAKAKFSSHGSAKASLVSSSPLPQPKPQPYQSFGPSPRTSLASSTGLCACPKPRAKRDPKKRRKPKVCVSKSQARAAGLI